MTPLKTTVFLIDDHPMLRNGVKQLINSAPQFQVIGEAGNGIDGLRLAEQLEPDIILLDINLHDISGLDLIAELRTKSITSRIIMFTVSDDKQDIITALKNGADGYLLKDMEPEDLLISLQKVSEGKVMMEDSISQIVFKHIQEKPERQQPRDLSLLTPRESEIFDLLIQGQSNKLIARNLDIMDSTVKVHVKSILKKLNFKSRMEITVWYLQNRN